MTRIIDYDIEKCPRCGRAHQFKLEVSLPAEDDEKVMLFGGASGGSEFLFTCPETDQKFSQIVPTPPKGKIVGLASMTDNSQLSSTTPSPADDEFSDWIKNSRKIALDFCKTMLGTSTGAIPIYFAVLKYIGFEELGTSVLANIAALPPVLLLVAAILYVLALRPKFEAVSKDDFVAFRARRLGRLNQYILWGTVAFASATGLSIAILFYALSQ